MLSVINCETCKKLNHKVLPIKLHVMLNKLYANVQRLTFLQQILYPAKISCYTT